MQAVTLVGIEAQRSNETTATKYNFMSTYSKQPSGGKPEGRSQTCARRPLTSNDVHCLSHFFTFALMTTGASSKVTFRIPSLRRNPTRYICLCPLCAPEPAILKHKNSGCYWNYTAAKMSSYLIQQIMLNWPCSSSMYTEVFTCNDQIGEKSQMQMSLLMTCFCQFW